jgi:Tol biopolymer transport system component/predicted Ser/Thr protein kinase
MVGTNLGHYRILKPLGSGGMGEVYLADDTRLQRQVALKILSAVASKDSLDRFEREAQVVAALNHPNIVTLFAIEHVGDARFLAMEYVDGRSVADVIPKGGLPLRRLLTIARQIVDAVIAAHERGIVHRDLKPANVMIAAGDRVKVLDFGLAKLREASEAAAVATMPTRELTGEGKIVGTVSYMSPEQAEGHPIDERTDIFSLGVMLYEMATGNRPFKGDTSLSILSSILRDTPKAVDDLNPALPRDLARIVRHCLAKDPDRRYQSAKDLRNDLEELDHALTSGELERPVIAAQTRRAPWIAAAAVGVAAAIGVAAIAWRNAGPSRAPLPRVTFARLTQSPGVEQFPTISPDGKWVVYAKQGDLFLQSVTGQTAINLTNDAHGNAMPAFSPDGEQIAFRSSRNGGGIFVMGRTGESVRRVTEQGWYPAWLPDARHLVISTNGPPGPESVPVNRADLLTVDVTTGETRPLVTGYYASQPRVSPHGQRVAYWALRTDMPDKNNRDIWTVPVGGGTAVRVTDHPANDWNPVWAPDGRWLYFLSNRSGSMNLWRVAIDEASGRTSGDAEPLTAPSPYVAHFSLSADGRIGAYAATVVTGNIARVAFDPTSASTRGEIEAVTTGANDFFGGYMDATRDGRFVAATTSARGQEDLFLVSTGDGTIQQLTNDFFRDRAPRWTVDDRRILFYSDRGGDYAVWSINADGGGLRQLTHDGWRGYPVSSPDGSRVVTDDIETHRLFMYDAKDWSKPIDALPPNPDGNVRNLMTTAWSGDGQNIVYATPDTVPARLWLFSIASRSHRPLVVGDSASWFKDSRRLVFSSGDRIAVFDTVTGSSREILRVQGERINGPRLAADDTQLFFTRGSIDGDIWLVRFGDAK